MMQKLRDPKNVKMISLFVAAIFVLGCFALTLTQSGVNSVASAASSESAIGVVNYQMLLSVVIILNNYISQNLFFQPLSQISNNPEIWFII